MKIIVGMSGGMDSTVASLLLKGHGHEVIGVTLDLIPEPASRPPASPERWQPGAPARLGGDGIASARRAAARIGVSHRVIDAREEFGKRVIGYFRKEYFSGRTPNPCVVCNPEIKFASLLRCADDLGAAVVATGHYARTVREGGRTLLLRGADRRKDQTYFLSRLPRSMLSRVIFPLGDRTKDEVRRISAERGMDLHERPESQETCFIPGNDYRAFLAQSTGDGIAGGDILDTRGAVIGRHPGIVQFTIGQRIGRWLPSRVRQYVLSIDPIRHAITVGWGDDLLRGECAVTDINWIARPAPAEPFHALVKIRSSHPGAPAVIHPGPGGDAVVRFDEPQKAVTPGQAAVFYDGDIVIGGGWIGTTSR